MNRIPLSVLAAALVSLASARVLARDATSAAAGEAVPPKLVFPTACLVMQSYQDGGADLTLTVDSDGKVGKVVVDQSSGRPLLDEAFRTALGKSRAVPGTVNGTPQPMTIAVRMVAKRGSTRMNGYAMTVTVTRGSQPRVAEYSCYGTDPNPFDPRVSL